jgi:hypothetical protein
MKEGMRIFTTGTDCSFSLIITIILSINNNYSRKKLKKSYKHYSAIKKEINKRISDFIETQQKFSEEA